MPIVQHTLTRPDGTPIVGTSIPVRLSQPAFLPGEQSEVIRTAYARTDDTGMYTIDLEPQSAYDPVGTYCEVSHPGGETLTFIVPDGPGPFWVRDLLTADPPQAQYPAQAVIENIGATVDPDDAGVLILTFPSWRLTDDGTAVLIGVSA